MKRPILNIRSGVKNTVTRRAPAKINLILSVGAAEPPESVRPGHHKIASWFALIDLADEVQLTRATGASEVRVSWAADAPRVTKIDWPIESDLAARAHRAMEAKCGRALPAKIEVSKRIPVGGGLGGGSSDAAAVLLGLRELFELDQVSDDALVEVAMSLGSDVAFFVRACGEAGETRQAMVGEFGERVELVEGVPGEVLLVMPEIGCQTGAVYKAFDAWLVESLAQERLERIRAGIPNGRERDTGAKPDLVRRRYEKCLRRGVIESDAIFNDLAIPAFRVAPALGELSADIGRVSRLKPHVTGSGSCLFLVGDEKEIASAEARLARQAAEHGGAAVVRRVRLLA